MPDKWEDLDFGKQELLLDSMAPKELAKKFKRDVTFFEHMRKFVESIPKQTEEPKARPHSPPKDLVISARRDLSFYEANYELIDNSIDAWRRNGTKKDLHIELEYNLELLTGRFADDAGGLDEGDVYKVFIPGETTNRDFTQNVIGSFGMGAKKGIFRLTDGARIISCKSSKFSATSEVPEKWELSPNWETRDGRANATKVGRTEIYFFKLFAPPSTIELDELVRRCSIQYRPLLAGEFLKKNVSITVNDTEVKAARGPIWSGAKGASPRRYEFTQTFPNFLNSGKDIELRFAFLVGLTQHSAGKNVTERDEDWGIDVFGNGRLIERFRKTELGFGTTGLGTRAAAMNYFRAELFIDGHSFAIPWDTHKREYLKDHPVTEFLRQRLRPILLAYATLANTFGNDKRIRNDFLEGLPFSGPTKIVKLAEDEQPKPAQLPKWEYDDEVEEEDEVDEDAEDEDAEDENEDDAEDDAEIIESPDDEIAVGVTMSRADRELLYERLEVADEDELATVLGDILNHGIAFSLTPAEFKAAKKLLKCEDANQLSQKVKDQLVGKLRK